MPLSAYKILTFDVYGTLIDWESGMIAGLAPLLDRLPVPLSRDAVLEAHAYHESTQQAWTPGRHYRDILAIVYRRLAEEWGLEASWEACQNYGASVGQWPAFPDSHDALRVLQEHFQLAVLTNTDNVSFVGSNTRLGVRFDGVFTAEDIGSYKPDVRNFEYMLGHLARRGIGKGDVLHVAESLFHDHKPANAMGLANAWIYRRHAKEGFGATMDPGERPSVDFQFTSMAEFAAAVEAETR